MVSDQGTIRRFEPAQHEDYDELIGRAVFTTDEQKIGMIKSAFHPQEDFAPSRGRHFFLLEPGLIKDWFGGLDDFYFPETLISGVSLERVYIDMTYDGVKNANWEKPPVIDTYREV